MPTQISLFNETGLPEVTASLSTLPDTCPICHRIGAPRVIGGQMSRALGFFQVIFRCASNTCQQCFIATYSLKNDQLLRQPEPLRPQRVTIPDEVAKMSPAFVDVYTQAKQAEAHSFDQLVGIGLRKALEFLIKDFAIKEHPGETEPIKAMWLGPVIEKYVDDALVKRTAKLAVWLGNDETHYVRKWENKDIEDLKRLVALTVNWIQNYIVAHQYFQEMDPPKSS